MSKSLKVHDRNRVFGFYVSLNKVVISWLSVHLISDWTLDLTFVSVIMEKAPMTALAAHFEPCIL